MLYDPPPPPMGYGSSSGSSSHHSGHHHSQQHSGHTSHQHHLQQASGHGGCPPSASSMRSYISGMGPAGQNSLLRLDEPRIYSSSALQLGSGSGGSSGGGSGNLASLQRSSSPQNHHHHFIDRSISLIRLDNSNSGLILPPGSNSLSTTHESNNSISSGQSR